MINNYLVKEEVELKKMNEDILDAYQKHYSRSIIPDDQKLNESDLLKYAHHKRYSSYLAYLHTATNCSNETSCFVLEGRLKDYSSAIDNRKGINNFASVAKSLGNNVTNVSKKWSSGLQNQPSDFSLKKFLKCNDSNDCENPSPQGCTAGIPSQQHVDHFFQTLSKVKQENQVKPTSSSHFVSDEQKNVEKKKSLYSTYEDTYLDQMRGDNTLKFQNKLSQQKINFKQVNSDAFEPKGHQEPKGIRKDVVSGLDNFSSKRLNQFQNSNIKPYYPPSSSAKNPSVSDENGFSKRPSTVDRIKKLSKYLNEDEQEENRQLNVFKTASETLKIQKQVKQNGGHGNQYGCHPQGTGVKKSLGGKGRSGSNRFVPPLRSSQEEEGDMLITRSVLGRPGPGNQPANVEPVDERLSHIDPKMVELIRSEIMDHGATITWNDIAGLDFAKLTIQEIVVWPMLRPDIFTGLRQPPKGILLFGPPGTGKTLIGKCIASQSKSTFFSISASSLTSKWIGDGEKMVRALFAVARVEQPSVVFIDEIDSLLSQRSDQEHESSRRIKTEFLVQLDGAATGEEERILIIGATNRPQELDEAARRRLVKRLYIPLPDFKARKMLVNNLMSKEKNDLTESDLEEIGQLTDGYSGADMKNLCQEASLGPIRTLSASLIEHINPDQVRPVNIEDFKQALKRVRSSVSSKDLELYIEWDRQFGMSS